MNLAATAFVALTQHLKDGAEGGAASSSAPLVLDTGTASATKLGTSAEAGPYCLAVGFLGKKLALVSSDTNWKVGRLVR